MLFVRNTVISQKNYQLPFQGYSDLCLTAVILSEQWKFLTAVTWFNLVLT